MAFTFEGAGHLARTLDGRVAKGTRACGFEGSLSELSEAARRDPGFDPRGCGDPHLSGRLKAHPRHRKEGR